MRDAEVSRIAELLGTRNEVDWRITAIIKGPMTSGISESSSPPDLGI